MKTLADLVDDVGSVAALARRLDCPRPQLSEVVRCLRQPSAKILMNAQSAFADFSADAELRRHADAH